MLTGCATAVMLLIVVCGIVGQSEPAVPCAFAVGSAAGCRCGSGTCTRLSTWTFQRSLPSRTVLIATGGTVNLGTLTLSSLPSLTGATGSSSGPVFGLSSGGAEGVFDSANTLMCYYHNRTRTYSGTAALASRCTSAAAIGFCTSGGSACCHPGACMTEVRSSVDDTTNAATASSQPELSGEALTERCANDSLTCWPPTASGVVLIVGAAVGGVIIIAVIVCCITVRAKERHLLPAHTETPTAMEGRYVTTSATNVSEDHDDAYSSSSHTGDLVPNNIIDAGLKAPPSTQPRAPLASRSLGAVWRIELDQLEFGCELGKGAFGIVRKAEWRGKSVAVKQIKRDAIGVSDDIERAHAEFESEIARMASLPLHENVVQLFGVTTLASGDVAAVVEFCARGSLVDALYGHGRRSKWSPREQMRVAHDAACGVAHLHRNDLVHRDIAARNVLLAGKHDLIAKVADFGMARDMTDEAYERHTLNPVGPLRWMAPEQMTRQAYSKASDAFAFGVLLYEIFEQETPWKGSSNIVVATKVMAGERMDVSSGRVDRIVAALMRECWLEKPSRRPTLDEIERRLRQEIHEYVSMRS